MPYITWERYCSLYTDISTEEEFTAVEALAEIKFNSITHLQAYAFIQDYDAQTATPFDKQRKAQIEMTMADLIHRLVTFKANNVGAGVSSISNEGFAVSLDIINDSGIQAELISIVRGGMAGTGLNGVM